MRISNVIKRAKLDGCSQWINEDIQPIESSRRTWSFLTFHNMWLLINCNIATFLTGSALIPLGLTWWQAIISIVLGNILATIALLLSSLAGAHYHIGFAVFNRAVWGMWGSQFPICNRVFLGFVWYGFQAWIGGECVYLMLLAFDPKYESRIPNTIPEETGMTSAQFLAYVLFSIASLPALWIRPHRLDKFFKFASVVTLVFFIVLLIWALATMGPDGFGATLDSTSDLEGSVASTAWLMIYGIMSTIGSIAAGIMNQNDYARLSKRPADAIWGQAFAFPLYGIFASVLGILVTAATQKRLGEAVWNPPTLFVRLLEMDNSAGTRAAIFFAGLALCISQVGSSLPGNALAGGIDLASIFPRYINIRRGAYIIALLSPIVNPWRLVNTATTFLTVLSSYSVFLAPMTGIMAANYLQVNKQKLNVEDLYIGNDNSIYWYSYGINWRAPVAWLVGSVPCLPGFVAAVNLSITVPDSATQLYNLNYLYGFLASAVAYSALHWVFPATRINEFVRNNQTAEDLRSMYEQRWESVTLGRPVELLDDKSDFPDRSKDVDVAAKAV